MRAAVTAPIAIIVNPVSGGADNRGLAAALEQRLRTRGYGARVMFTSGRGDGRRFAGSLAPETPVVLAVGGDGTINEVVDGLAGRPIPVLVVPRGTENLLGKYLKIRVDLDWIAAAADRPRCVDFDVAVANGRSFLCVSGIGIDAEVIQRLEHRRRGHIHHLDYFWPLWRTICGYSFPTIRVEVDGAPIFEDRGIAFVGNANRYAFNLGILREARPDDGLLDVCIYRCASRSRLLVHSLRTLLHRHIGKSGVIYLKARHIRMSAVQPLPVEIDGELFGTTPVEYTVRPKAVRLVVGAAA